MVSTTLKNKIDFQNDLIPLNLNSEINVKLNEKGKQIYKSYLTGWSVKNVEEYLSADYVKFQLYDFMNIFGPSLYAGGDTIILDNEIFFSRLQFRHYLEKVIDSEESTPKEMKTCPHCNETSPKEADYCVKCGVRFWDPKEFEIMPYFIRNDDKIKENIRLECAMGRMAQICCRDCCHLVTCRDGDGPLCKKLNLELYRLYNPSSFSAHSWVCPKYKPKGTLCNVCGYSVISVADENHPICPICQSPITLLKTP